MIETNKVFVNRTFSCDAENLFDWLTNPELLVQWFGSQGFEVGEVKSELAIGGAYSIELKKEPATSFKVVGKYIDIVKPSSLNFTYDYAGLASPPPPSVVRITLSKIDAETTSLKLVQEFSSPSHDNEKRTVAWNYMMELLSKMIT